MKIIIKMHIKNKILNSILKRNAQTNHKELFNSEGCQDIQSCEEICTELYGRGKIIKR